MGPAPMIRMVEISLRLGIKSHGPGIGTKKGRAHRASPYSQQRGGHRARLVLNQFPQPRKGLALLSTGILGWLAVVNPDRSAPNRQRGRGARQKSSARD